MNAGTSPRVALIADRLGPVHGATWAAALLSPPGYTTDVLHAAATQPELAAYDIVHIGSPHPPALAAGRPVVGSFHVACDPAFYAQCALVLSPSESADRVLVAYGVGPDRISRWAPGVDAARFHPARYAPDAVPDGFVVLYVGPVDAGANLEVLLDGFLIARDRNPRLHLVIAGTGPHEPAVRRRLRSAVTLVEPPSLDELAGIYASADLLVAPNPADLFGLSIVAAHASGLPVLAVDGGAAAELIESGRNGCLVPAQPEALAGALAGLARRAALCDRLVTGGLVAARTRALESSVAQLSAGYARALSDGARFAGEVARAA